MSEVPLYWSTLTRRKVKPEFPRPRDRYFIAEQPAPAPYLARPEGRAALKHMC